MSGSRRLETRSSGGADHLTLFFALADRALAADGQPPFSDQTVLHARSGRLPAHVVFDGAEPVAAWAVADQTLELVVDPAYRGRGVAQALLPGLLADTAPDAITAAWSHGDHPAARHIAPQFGFEPARRLLQLRMVLGGSATGFETRGDAPLLNRQTRGDAPRLNQQTRGDAPLLNGRAEDNGITFDTFRPGHDDVAWVALNARVFAAHPEQGKLTVDDLHARMREPWFDADDFLVARGENGSLVGYNWLKIEPGPVEDHAATAEPGEIYVIGVAAEASGQGLGRELMTRGLNRLHARGCVEAALYVEEDNGPAVPLYRSLGFIDHTVDVQYRRT